jgi:hypothetical protein
MIGFKFILPTEFPIFPPYAYLDEPINQQVIEFFDYVEEGNLLNFEFLDAWKKFYAK